MSDLRQLGEQAFREGRNVTQTLRDHLGVHHNTPEAIEIAYDLQAGSYVQSAESRPDVMRAYADQLASLLDPHLHPSDTLLDAGTGEMTTLVYLDEALQTPLSKIYATDISEARLEVGRAFAAKHGLQVEAFRAELSAILLEDKSVDVVTTNHAIEPNGGREAEILTELVRVGRKLVLFEPCYEIASDEAKERMRSHGYIRGLAEAATSIGATVESVVPLKLVHNPLNPTACFVIT
jgi:hypothetical protein